MNEVTARLKSVHLKNERLIWVRPPRDRSSAAKITIFLDGELYRDRVGANWVIDGLQGAIADSWFVYVSMESVEARWLECACYQPFARFVAEELLPWLSDQHREMLDSLPAFADRTYADALSLRSSSGFDAALELAPE